MQPAIDVNEGRVDLDNPFIEMLEHIGTVRTIFAGADNLHPIREFFGHERNIQANRIADQDDLEEICLGLCTTGEKKVNRQQEARIFRSGVMRSTRDGRDPL